MEPAAFAFAVVSMFETCVKGYQLISDAGRAPADAQAAARRIRIEYYQLATWGEHFEIGHGRHRVGGTEKLKVYLSKGPILNGVFDTLTAIAELFTDVTKMHKTYGLVFGLRGDDDNRKLSSPQDVQDLLDRHPAHPPLAHSHSRRHRARSRSRSRQARDEVKKKEALVKKCKADMSVLGRCQWALSGKNRVHQLTKDLREYNDDLIRLCAWETQVQINRGLATVALPRSHTIADLNLLADAATDDARDDASPSTEGRRRLADLARFKAKIKTPDKFSEKYMKEKGLFLRSQDFQQFQTPELPSTLAIHTIDRTAVFIEWKSYLNMRGQPDTDVEYQIFELANLLSVSDRPTDFRSLTCIGLFKDTPRSRYGLAYKLPWYMRDLPVGDSHDLSNRKPISLRDLMTKVEGPIDLGLRFQLAKKLINSVIVMHTCGWLHKSIRSDSIFFFPAEPNDAKSPVRSHRKDVGKPVIMGYGFSRPDDVGKEAAGRRLPVSVEEVYPEARRRKNVSTWEEPKIAVSNSAARPPLNIYQHPDRARDSSTRFRHTYDVYSLGLVLLEIGLWQALESVITDNIISEDELRQFILSRLVPDLWGQCGSIYGKVVRECLTLRSESVAMEEESQRRLCWDIAERLDQCVA
ncbi:MAG: hypothetical protein M1833_002676 [Piccolia ochrophora]|nr:MAG: hypothetical protein M1833_002676 [Piccolia ochrophora]